MKKKACILYIFFLFQNYKSLAMDLPTHDTQEQSHLKLRRLYDLKEKLHSIALISMLGNTQSEQTTRKSPPPQQSNKRTSVTHLKKMDCELAKIEAKRMTDACTIYPSQPDSLIVTQFQEEQLLETQSIYLEALNLIMKKYQENCIELFAQIPEILTSILEIEQTRVNNNRQNYYFSPKLISWDLKLQAILDCEEARLKRTRRVSISPTISVDKVASNDADFDKAMKIISRARLQKATTPALTFEDCNYLQQVYVQAINLFLNAYENNKQEAFIMAEASYDELLAIDTIKMKIVPNFPPLEELILIRQKIGSCRLRIAQNASPSKDRTNQLSLSEKKPTGKEVPSQALLQQSTDQKKSEKEDESPRKLDLKDAIIKLKERLAKKP